MQPDPSPLEAALLGLLARGPASGYELRKVFQTTSLVDLRLALISDVTPVRLPTFLQEYADAVDVHLAELTTAAAALEPELSPSAASALDRGIHVIRARKAL